MIRQNGTINTIENIFMYLVEEGISIPILLQCLSSLWQLHTGDFNGEGGNLSL